MTAIYVALVIRAPYPVLERVSSKPTLDLLYVCQELCRRSILTEVYDGGALSLAFAQAEFRELTYSRIPALSRRILHLNIAQAQAALAQADYAAARQALAQADRATGYLKEPSGYFQTLFCVYSALKGKAGVFELELLHRLDLGSADPLPGLLQVTEN